jgi:hypothetical protein
MRNFLAILLAGLLATASVMTTAAEAQTIRQPQTFSDDWFDSPGLYIVGGIASVGIALGILVLTENHHHPRPVSP